MKNRFVLSLIPLFVFPLAVGAQDKKTEWEFGAGGSVVNLTRTMVSDFHQTEGGDYVFRLEDKHLYGGTYVYAAMSLSEKWFLDVQGTLGLARYFDNDVSKQGFSMLAGPGIQFRPFKHSQWIVPYLRVGVNAYHKTFKTRYLGTFDKDVTGEGRWCATDAWNKGYTLDNNTFFPVSVGVGAVGWVSNRIGIRIQGQFMKAVIKSGPSFVELSAGVQLRLGGRNKNKVAADSYVSSHLSEYDDMYMACMPEKQVVRETVREVVKEVPVEKEVVRYVKSDDKIVRLMDNIHFDFDKYSLPPESGTVLDEIAEIICSEPTSRYLISGYTDAKGSSVYNERLSLNRAASVFDALVERGVSKDRLVVEGFGKRIALSPESSSEEERKMDRKVLIERID